MIRITYIYDYYHLSENFQKMEKRNIDFIIFDMIGTTIKDSNSGASLIINAFQQAFHSNGYEISYEKLNQQRGKRKLEAVRNILQREGLDEELTNKIYADFMNLLHQSVHAFSAIDGAVEAFHYAKEKNIKIGLGSGLPIDFMRSIIQQVGWKWNDFDYIGSSDELPKGRPHPVMILEAMKKLNLKLPSKVLKIGDTVVDVQEGKNAHVLTAMVLTGTQGKQDLADLMPDYILDSVKDVIEVF